MQHKNTKQQQTPTHKKQPQIVHGLLAKFRPALAKALAAAVGGGAAGTELRAPPLAVLVVSHSPIARWRQVAGLAVFVAAYSVFVALLFEPPLPPLSARGFRGAHKATLLLTSWLAFVVPMDLDAMRSRARPGQYAFALGGKFWAIYVPIVMGLWLGVHVLWPLRPAAARWLARRRAARRGAEKPAAAVV